MLMQILLAMSLASAILWGAAGASRAQAFDLPEGGGERSTDAPPLPAPVRPAPGLRHGFGQSNQGFGTLKRGFPSVPPDTSAAARGAQEKSPSGQKSAAQDAVSAKPLSLKKALQPKPPPEALRAHGLDVLFERLKDASNLQEAEQTAREIAELWLQSGSATADLLMQRAMTLSEAGNRPLALSLFDKLVLVAPDWPEAWNQRATARYLAGDPDGAMADINKTLKLEPRHFGALEGMGLILRAEGFDSAALQVFKKALSIFPLAPDLPTFVKTLTHEVEGEDI